MPRPISSTTLSKSICIAKKLFKKLNYANIWSKIFFFFREKKKLMSQIADIHFLCPLFFLFPLPAPLFAPPPHPPLSLSIFFPPRPSSPVPSFFFLFINLLQTIFETLSSYMMDCSDRIRLRKLFRCLFWLFFKPDHFLLLAFSFFFPSICIILFFLFSYWKISIRFLSIAGLMLINDKDRKKSVNKEVFRL